MKVLNKSGFLMLPAGTIYTKGKQWYFEGLCIKDDTAMHGEDWYYLDPCWPQENDRGDAMAVLENSLENGTSFKMEDAVGRDGLFDDDDVFLVFERKLRAYIDKAISVTKS